MANIRKRTTAGHPAPFENDPATRTIRRGIRVFVPDGKHAAIVALFEHRTTIGTIRQWRHGRRRAPKWAVAIIDALVANLDEIRNDARAALEYERLGYANNIPACRAAQMEKARG